uniref:Threonylcarbamoyl-AMP synthase n=1 Tax=Kalanchoe fedtschenkoi TaxID=63787 RepID=A0A7N0R8N8_KALFE
MLNLSLRVVDRLPFVNPPRPQLTSLKGGIKHGGVSVAPSGCRLQVGGRRIKARSLKVYNVCIGNGVGVIHPATEDYADEAVEAVKAGKVIAVPTDTLYGLACDACSLEAVNRIYEIKGRAQSKPIAICVGDVSDIQRFAVTDHLPVGLLKSLLPGPVTVVLRRGDLSILEKTLNPGIDSIGVRVPDCKFIRAIARGSGSALALTSANLSGEPSSVCTKDFEKMWHQIAYVYDGGLLPAGRAGSTIVDLSNPGTYKIVRPGSAEKETVAIVESYSLVQRLEVP